jgi:phospholipid transport system substrate-binding protein
MQKITVYISLYLILLLSPFKLFADEGKPRDIVRQLLDSISMVKDKAVVQLSPEERQNNEKFIQKANSLIDIKSLGPKTLGSHWGKRTANEKEAFLSALTKLFEKVAYPKSAKFFVDLKITYDGEKINKEKAIVNTSMEHESEGLIEIDYKLHKVNNEWLIHDVVLDGVSLAMNLKTKFHQIVQKSSFDELVAKMNKRLESAE